MQPSYTNTAEVILMEKKQAFIQTIQQNEALIYNVAGFYVNNLHDREDLVQEIIYQLWKSFDSFNNSAGISTWLYRVAMNTAIYFLKQSKRRVPAYPVDENMLQHAATDDVETEERLKTMYNYIKELNLLEKGVLMLYLEGKSHEEIGRLTGITTSNVGTKLSRIREKLKNKIAKTL